MSSQNSYSSSMQLNEADDITNLECLDSEDDNDIFKLVNTSDISDYMPDHLRTKKFCLVCGDVASGLHYGVASCEACKAFFKRTIQGQIEYKCLSIKKCEISKRRRKTCKACRLQKCFSVGMLKEGVRVNRIRGGRQKYKKNDLEDQPFNTFALNILGSDCTELTNLLQSIEPKDKFTVFNKDINNVDSFQPIGEKIIDEHPIRIEEIGLKKSPENCDHFNQLFFDLLDCKLVETISWLKQMPTFISLDITTQIYLIQSSWLDVYIFNLSYRSSPQPAILLLAEDLNLGQEATNKFFSKELGRLLFKLTHRMNQLNLSQEEYILLKSFILFSSAATDLINTHSTISQRHLIQDALLATIALNHAPSNHSIHAPSNQFSHAPSNHSIHAPSNHSIHASNNQFSHAPSNQSIHAPSNADSDSNGSCNEGNGIQEVAASTGYASNSCHVVRRYTDLLMLVAMVTEGRVLLWVWLEGRKEVVARKLLAEMLMFMKNI